MNILAGLLLAIKRGTTTLGTEQMYTHSVLTDIEGADVVVGAVRRVHTAGDHLLDDADTVREADLVRATQPIRRALLPIRAETALAATGSRDMDAESTTARIHGRGVIRPGLSVGVGVLLPQTTHPAVCVGLATLDPHELLASNT